MFILTLFTTGLIMSLAITGISSAATHDFYKGKTINLVVGGGPGGGTDTLARHVARLLDTHLGTEHTIVQNMPGAGGVVMANYMSSVAKPDGLTLGFYIGASLALRQIALAGSIYDLRELSWVGVLEPLQNVLVADARKYKSIDDLKSAKGPIPYGLVAKGGMSQFMGITVSKLSGVDFNFIPGYGGGELSTAMQRGEIDITAGNALPFIDGIRSGNFTPLMVMSRFRDPAVPEVPTVQEAMGHIPAPWNVWVDLGLVRRFVFGPPGIPQERLTSLREALEKVSKDPRLQAMAEKQGVLLKFISGGEARQITADFLDMPEDQVNDLKKLLQ